MTHQQLGRLRDERILALVSRFGCLTTAQVCRALFSGKSAAQSCTRRLRILTRRGKLHRERIYAGGQYVYSAGRVGQVEHRLAVAEVYLQALRERQAGERIEFQTEYALSGGDRADALLTWEMRDATAYAFIEVQRSGKAALGKYRRFLLSGAWQLPVYPRIVVVGRVGKVPTGLTVVECSGSVRAAVCAKPC